MSPIERGWRPTEQHRRVIDALSETEWMTTRALREATGLNHNQTLEVLAMLYVRGIVLRKQASARIHGTRWRLA